MRFKNCVILALFSLIIYSCSGVQSNSSKDLKFAFLTDIHVSPGNPNEENLKRAVYEINLLDVDMVMVTGDLTNSGTNAELQTVKEILDQLNKPYHIIPGNHETNWSESAGQKFVELWGNDRFVVEWNNYLLIGFNTGPYMKMGDGHVKQEDLLWLKDELAERNSPKKRLLSFTHYPLTEGLDNWFEVTSILKENNCLADFCGHLHTLKLDNFDGIPGILGRSLVLRNSDIPGYNIVEINKDSLFVFEKIIDEPISDARIAIALNSQEAIKDLPVSTMPDYSVNEEYPDIKTTFEWSDSSSIFTGISLVGDSLFIYGNSLGQIKAVNHLKNKVEWQAQFKGSFHSTPSLGGETIVVGSIDGSVYGLDVHTGKTNWRVEVGSPVIASPLIVGNAAFIGGGNIGLYKIDITSGEVLWKFDEIGGLIQAQPVIDKDNLIFGVWDTNLYCISASTGKLKWKWNNGRSHTLLSPGNVKPVISGNKVILVAPDRYMTALNLETGKQLWRTNKHQVRESMGISPDGKEVFAKLMNDSIISVDTRSNTFKTNWAVDAGIGYDHNPCPLIANQQLVIGATKNGLITTVNRQTQEVQWMHKVGNSSVNQLTMDNENNIWMSLMEGKVLKISQPN